MPLFNSLRLRGAGGSILWGSNAIPAAALKTWTISNGTRPGEWALVAAMNPIGVDAFKLRQTPLYFTAPRVGGFWMWPVRSVQLGTAELRATLAPPEL